MSTKPTVRPTPRSTDRYFPLFTALNEIIDAWESLEGGRNYGPREVERWLSDKMTPAIQKGRDALGRRRPDEGT